MSKRMSKREICPKCHTSNFYAEKDKGKWMIRCARCNYQTSKYDTMDNAWSEWDKGEQG